MLCVCQVVLLCLRCHTLPHCTVLVCKLISFSVSGPGRPFLPWAQSHREFCEQFAKGRGITELSHWYICGSDDDNNMMTMMVALGWW